MKIKMKNATRKQFEESVLAYQFSHLKFRYLKTKCTIKYTPEHKAFDLVGSMSFTYNAHIAIVKGRTFVFFTCEGYFDLSEIFGDHPEKEGVLFIIDRNFTTDEFEKFFDEFTDSEKMRKLMESMREEYLEKYHSRKETA